MACFFIGIALGRKNNLVLLLFGILSFCIGVYLTLFIQTEEEGLWGTRTMIASAFIVLHMMTLPWFIGVYTGYLKKFIILLLNATALLAYIIYLTPPNNMVHWDYVAIPGFLGIFLYGMFAGYIKFKKNGDPDGLYFIIPNFIGLVTALVTYFPGIVRQIFPSVDVFQVFETHTIVYIVIVALEIRSELKRSERLERQVAAREIRWRKLIDKSHLLIIATDQQGKIQYFNPHFSDLTGYTQQKEIISQPLDEFLIDVDKSELLELYTKPGTEVIRKELLLKPGKTRSILWSSLQLHDEYEKPDGFLFIGTDISDLEDAHAEINQLKKQLEEENIDLKKAISFSEAFPEIIGTSKAIRYVLEKIQQVADSESAVLIEGETGVGKELVARSIHHNSQRSEKPFFTINCSAIPRELMESELFGHEKGSFTGAYKMKKGRFELADGGTIFLDEIGELPLELQPKLLRVLQNGEFERVGGERTIASDVRIISATNRNLREEITAGNFREDLYYRLNVYPITVPPLRSRREDIPLISRFYIKQLSRKMGKNITHISQAVDEQLIDHDWPGNIRELINVLERAVIQTSGKSLRRLDPFYKPVEGNEKAFLSMEEMEKKHLLGALEKTNWKISGWNST